MKRSTKSRKQKGSEQLNTDNVKTCQYFSLSNWSSNNVIGIVVTTLQIDFYSNISLLRGMLAYFGSVLGNNSLFKVTLHPVK